MRMVYTRIGFRWEWYTKGQVLDDRGMQKDRFYARLVFKRIGQVLDETGMQKDRFGMRVIYTRISFLCAGLFSIQNQFSNRRRVQSAYTYLDGFSQIWPEGPQGLGPAAQAWVGPSGPLGLATLAVLSQRIVEVCFTRIENIAKHNQYMPYGLIGYCIFTYVCICQHVCRMYRYLHLYTYIVYVYICA